jgi:MFS family permease
MSAFVPVADNDTGGAAAQDSAVYPSLWRAWFAVSILMLVTFTALLDRYLPAIALGPMRAELALSDTSISLIQGLAFSLFYCLAGVPIGRLVDRRNRRNLILVAVALWSALTVWTGLAHSFTELFLARAGVGIAEAVLAPATYSMIADSFPARLRGRAIGIYFTSLILGSGASFIVGGKLLAWLAASHVSLPIVGILAPWRGAFVIIALAGIPALLAGLTLAEPKRHGVTTRVAKGVLSRFFRENARAMTLLLSTSGLMAFVSTIAISWSPTLYNRNYGVSVPSAAAIVGLTTLLGGCTGAFTSGFFGDYWVRQPGGGRLRVQIASIIVSTPFLILWPLMPNTTLSYALLTITGATITFGMANMAATIQAIAPNQLRGQLIAINAIIMLLTSGLSPTVVALVTDHVFANPLALPWAIAIVGGVFGVLGSVVSLIAAGPYAGMRPPPVTG